MTDNIVKQIIHGERTLKNNMLVSISKDKLKSLAVGLEAQAIDCAR